MGTGGFSWDRGVGVAVAEGGAVAGKNQTWFQFRERSGANTQPKSGFSIQSQLVWLYHMQDISFRQFVGIFFVFFLSAISFVFLSFLN